MMKLKLIVMSTIVCFCLSAETNAKNDKNKPKITKCKDEKGVWHYGSSNLYRCADSSKITTLNERGVRLGQVDEVKTKEQLAADERKKEEERLALEKKKFEQLEKARILTVYQSEDDIERARQEKMKSYERKINQHKNYIEALANREKLLNSKKGKTNNASLKKQFSNEIKALEPKADKSRTRIAELQKEKLQAGEKYDQDLIIFRKYKS